jgi:hypothetical protein
MAMSKETASEIVRCIKDRYAEGEPVNGTMVLVKGSKLTDREFCEDVMEIFGIPEHTRREVCQENFG